MHTDHPTPPVMAAAVAVDHRHGLKLPTWKRRCRLLSFPHQLYLFEPGPPSAFPSPAATPAPRAPSAGDGHLKRTRKFSRSLSTPCLYSAAAQIAAADEPRRDSIARLEIVSGRRSLTIHALVVEAAIALASGATPVPVADGISAAHYLFNRFGESFAVMKVMDIDGPPPPQQQGRSPLKHVAAQASDMGVREVAAYLLDHGAFANVPPTALITISRPISCEPTKVVTKRIASIQRFVAHGYDAGELGPSRFSVASVHRIGILDVRILNVDRHAGNILVKKENSGRGNEATAELVPIDHGLCLPEQLEDPYFEWLHWPQATVPFSEAEAEYVARLEPFRDVELLQAELPSLQEASRRVLVVCTTFLKRAVEAGLCLAEIGHMMTREFSSFSEGASELEALCSRVEESMRNTSRSPPDHALQQSDEEEASGDAAAAADFLFDMNDNDGIFPEQGAEDLPDVPLLLRNQVEGSINAFDDHHEAVADVSDSEGSVKEHRLNFSAVESNSGGIRSVSFEGLSEKEWRLFLERFERLLPEAFKTRKSMGHRGLVPRASNHSQNKINYLN
ncbi:phosphatidylinositol 4-kinase gamma 8-like [Curcuma longa]|uniref:phosphatidylinositol 4-kinase gamma 8-like n=1 Tax=Curcuma longa TaxID=136217 RepID=UPI003D9F96C8